MATLPELFIRIDVSKAELDSLRPLDKEREGRVMQKFRLWWNYHSNAIEGNKLSQGETELFLMEGLTAKGKPLKDHLDLRGHNDAINFLLSLIKDKREISGTDIRDLHKILLVEPYEVDAITPDGHPTKKMVQIGEYKTLPNHVKTRTGEIHYYAKPEETPAKMQDLLAWYREERAKGTMHPVEIVARFHHRFTAIHPFDDGNGRMSRLLMNLMLMQDAYPPTVIRIGERNEYLAGLQNADRDEYDDFIGFVGKHVEESLNLFIQSAQGIEVSEPTDLGKEIALELLRLKHIEEPVTKSHEVLLELYRNSLTMLVSNVINQMVPFCELFTESVLKVESTVTRGNTGMYERYQNDLPSANFLEHIKQCFADNGVPYKTDIEFKFIGFRKGRFDTFDHSVSLEIGCEMLKYNVKSPLTKPIMHFYQEPLTKDEINLLTQNMARNVLSMIQTKTKSLS